MVKLNASGNKYTVKPRTNPKKLHCKSAGSRDGEEVVQLYAKFNGDDASKRLRGFERVAVKAGETVPVEIVVPADDLKLWDSAKHAFGFRKGRTKIMIGASSEDIRLKKRIRL